MIEKKHQLPYANIYRGPVGINATLRNVKAIEANLHNQISFDELLTTIAENLPDGSSFFFLDFGSGQGLSLESLRNTGHVPGFLRVLSEKNIKLQAIGLTDSPTSTLHNTVDLDFKARNLPDQNGQQENTHQLTNYFYTLTRAQTLKEFLDSHQVEKLHFILASQSLMYLSAKNFQETVDEMVARIPAGGQLLVWGVGHHFGTAPAFTGASAFLLRGEENSQQVAILNLFAEYATAHTAMPLLTLRKEWPRIKKAVPTLIEALKRRGFVPNPNSEQYAKEAFERYQRVMANPDKYEELHEAGLAQTNDHEAWESIKYYYMLYPMIGEMRQRQRSQQAAAKQKYLRSLAERDNIDIQPLARDAKDGVVSFLLTKKKPNEPSQDRTKAEPLVTATTVF